VIFPSAVGTVRSGKLRVDWNDRHGHAALAAIAGVLAAPPGLITSADLPLRGFAGRFNP
jgi:hypothetical protein